MLQRRQFHLPAYTCVMCGNGDIETRDHLFYTCPFAAACWNYLTTQFQVQDDIHDNISHPKDILNVLFHMEIQILAAWSI